ncbi:MAG: hypothetical protein GQ564_21975 [Bacteroidales bacterium]|nr:hypothetical protein [Bacteroidales bacterium]
MKSFKKKKFNGFEKFSEKKITKKQLNYIYGGSDIVGILFDITQPPPE